ncbi:leucyl aminopeptidase [Neomicrococcus aestuarii]|uniref:Probable cytosol aminopeptidase n=1 Tax=Neomicrococcus aestuarii TaxID=556325 RepID=A0A7W8X115_9MICC|nr:leucyl aminopeptidase [Neomicrococcus aestuarii]MBB5513787.1 leucyl aminopeptidase [Neomicrococcus aestuarii]
MKKNPELTLTAIAADLKKHRTDALVLAVRKTSDGPELLSSPLSAQDSEALESSFRALGVTGKADEVLRLPSLESTDAEVLVVAGVGSLDGRDDDEALRRAAGSVTRQVTGFERVTFAFPAETVSAAVAIAQGAALGAYSFESYRSEAQRAKTADEKVLREVVVATGAATDKALKPALQETAAIVRHVHHVRDLVNTPANDLYPETFAAHAKEAGSSLPVTVEVYDDARLAKEGFGGLLGVGRGSARPPRLVKVSYNPRGKHQHVAIVGKGITFDTGGISLKPALNMDQMKSDMAGAATALHAVLALAELKAPVRATAWLCLAENMPSGNATRPGDVITMFGGKTVEVLNTDAEGRLVMADGLAVASLEEPDVLLDIATLTGAQLVALGRRTAGIMGDPTVRDGLFHTAEAVGEIAWPMPLPEELRSSIASQVADLANIGERNGGMMTAAVFLEEFVGEARGSKIPWAHIDIAGPSYNDAAPYGYTGKNGTGALLRTLVEYARNLGSKN